MSKYTTEVRFICESLAGYDTSQGYNNVSNVINQSWDKIFDFDFPMWDDKYRSVLCKKILKHYYTREIGFETYGLWKLKLDTAMNEIMPYFNERYKTTVLEFNPLYDVDYTKTTNGQEGGDNSRQEISTKTGKDTNSGSDTDKKTGTVTQNKTGTVEDEKTGTVTDEKTGTIEDAKTGTITGKKTGTESDVMTGTVGVESENNETSNSKDKFSDTPQGGLVGVESGNYLTNVRIVDGTKHNEGDETTTYNTNDTVTHNTTDTETRNTLDTTTHDTTDTVTNNLKDTITHDTEDKTSYDTTETFTKGTQVDRRETGNVDESGSFSTTKEYIEHIIGKTGNRSYYSVIDEMRNSIINIDMEVIDSLKDLFIRLW